ncbi:MAG: SGNH/GDSL hydrolase family protein [Acidimicrobiales bacterium]
MPPRLLVAVALVVVVATAACSGATEDVSGGSGGPSVTEPARPLTYVSLGDSYSAGGGLPGAEQPCGRGPGAYPSLVMAHAGLAGSLHACNGATTADVLDRAQFPGEGPQIVAVTGEVDVVTISIGGNDIGFGPRIRDCVLGEQSCVRHEAAVNQDLAALEPRLAQVFGEVRRRAPGARLIVVGYPQLVADPDQARYQSCAGLTPDEARWVREKGVALGRVVRTNAEAAGARYVDSASRFAGHEACTAEPWMTGVTLTKIEGSFHPNAAGHQKLAELVEAAVTQR